MDIGAKAAPGSVRTKHGVPGWPDVVLGRERDSLASTCAFHQLSSCLRVLPSHAVITEVLPLAWGRRDVLT